MDLVEDKNNCLICRKALSQNICENVGTTKEFQLWGEDCAETLSDLLLGSPSHPFKVYFQEAGYCQDSQGIIRGINSSWKQHMISLQRIHVGLNQVKELLQTNFSTLSEETDVKLPDGMDIDEFYGHYSYDDVLRMLINIIRNGDFMSGDNSVEFVLYKCDHYRRKCLDQQTAWKGEMEDILGLPTDSPTGDSEYPMLSDIPDCKRRSKLPPGYFEIDTDNDHAEDLANTDSDSDSLWSVKKGIFRQYRKGRRRISSSSETSDTDDCAKPEKPVSNIDNKATALKEDDPKIREPTRKRRYRKRISTTGSPSLKQSRREQRIVSKPFIATDSSDDDVKDVLKESDGPLTNKDTSLNRKSKSSNSNNSSSDSSSSCSGCSKCSAKRSYSSSPSRSRSCSSSRASNRSSGSSLSSVSEDSDNSRTKIDDDKHFCTVDLCKKIFKTEHLLLTHVRKDHEDDPTPYYCKIPECTNKYGTYDSMWTHHKAHAKRLKTHATPLQKTYAAYCPLCGLGFDSDEILKTHSKIHEYHDGTNPFICEPCQKEFSNSIELKCHVEKIHIQSKVQCNICNRYYSTEEKLQFHMEVHSDNYVAKRCHNCYSKFKTETALQNHLRHCTNEPEEGDCQFQCEFCGECRKSKDTLTRHIRRYHRNGLKVYKCSLCDKQFKTMESIRRHEAVHAGIPTNVICELCGVSCCTNFILKRHYQRFHTGDRADRRRKQTTRKTTTLSNIKQRKNERLTAEVWQISTKQGNSNDEHHNHINEIITGDVAIGNQVQVDCVVDGVFDLSDIEVGHI